MAQQPYYGGYPTASPSHGPGPSDTAAYNNVGYGQLNDQQGRGGAALNTGTGAAYYTSPPPSSSMNKKAIWVALAVLALAAVVIVLILSLNSSSSQPQPTPETSKDGCTMQCGSHGTCKRNEAQEMYCDCAASYTGVRCESPSSPSCTLTCSKHGSCVLDENNEPSCECNAGYDGPSCATAVTSTCTPACSSHGKCTDGECVCSGGYTGTTCNVAPPAANCTPACSAHGTCTNGKCVCTDNYSGATCNVAPPVVNSTCSPACDATHGKCTDGKCVCSDNYTGTTCSTAPTPSCTLACGTHGTCTPATTTTTQKCTCKDNYKGTLCDQPPATETSTGSVKPPPVDDPVDPNDPLSCDKEFCGSSCTIPTLPAITSLKTNAKFPDPFMMISGTRITKKSEWRCRRAEIKAQAEAYEYGVKNPKAVTNVTGSFSGNKLTVTVDGKYTFTASITYPSKGTAPYPGLIGVDGGSLPTAMTTGLGIAIISLDTNAIATQTGTRGSGAFWSWSGNSNAGSLIGWAWGASRIIDALEKTPDAKINPKAIAVTGCSRNGKGALAMGAFDERVKLVIAHEGGAGGDACWRSSAADSKAQPLSSAGTESTWFKTNFQSTNPDQLPYDHHMVLSMVIPRGLFIIENAGWDWLGESSCVTCSSAARTIYEAFGMKDRIGFVNLNHQHCQTWPDSFSTALTPFVDRFLFGKNATTGTWSVSAGRNDNTKFVDWTLPALT